MYGKIKLPIVAAGLAIMLAPLAAPAMANHANSTATVAIDYDGLDLTSAKGRETLERRVSTAINAMCGNPVVGTADDAEGRQQCRTEARASAEPQIQKALSSANMRVASTR